jgi:hypothetical protein
MAEGPLFVTEAETQPNITKDISNDSDVDAQTTLMRGYQ